jgi:hypothetical protein
MRLDLEVTPPLIPPLESQIEDRVDNDPAVVIEPVLHE